LSSWTHCYQFDIPVPKGYVVGSPEEAREVVSKISGLPRVSAQRHSMSWKLCAFNLTDFSSDAPSVVKAQILAGGRGKGKYESDGQGGVRIMNS
jgi:succinyl-CoA synthetase beta subunit